MINETPYDSDIQLASMLISKRETGMHRFKAAMLYEEAIHACLHSTSLHISA